MYQFSVLCSALARFRGPVCHQHTTRVCVCVCEVVSCVMNGSVWCTGLSWCRSDPGGAARCSSILSVSPALEDIDDDVATSRNLNRMLLNTQMPAEDLIETSVRPDTLLCTVIALHAFHEEEDDEEEEKRWRSNLLEFYSNDPHQGISQYASASRGHERDLSPPRYSSAYHNCCRARLHR